MKQILFLSILLYSITASAQSNSVTLSLKNVSLHEILLEIKKQSGKNMVYNNNLIEKFNDETLELKEVILEDALIYILKNKNLDFKILNDVIIIKPEEKSYPGLKQTIKGKVIDNESEEPLNGASILIDNTNPLKGSVADEQGNFKIENVPVGRYNIIVKYLGYEPYIFREVLVGTGREIVLNIGLKESVTELDEIQIKPNSNKDRPLNTMATLSARQFSVEEASRYAGGMDDPSRLVTSFAGVTSSGQMNNGIVIRGNAPKGLLWRMEGVDIPCPNHFNEFFETGGGMFTALSSQTMTNSDFYTGAFPAQYGNALSGVFDINMRTGNTEKREHTVQIGILGIDLATEGPFGNDNNSSYLVNYRYSSSGLITQILQDWEITKYQDLSFKLNFVTKKAGTFSVWGIGFLDHMYFPESNPGHMRDFQQRDFQLSMGAAGVTHKKIVTNKLFVQTTFSPSGNSIIWTEGSYDNNYNYYGSRKITDSKWKYTLTSSLNFKYNSRVSNRTGFTLNKMMYNIDNKNRQASGGGLVEMPTVNLGNGGSYLFQFFSQTKLNLTDKLMVNGGIHSQYFALNNNYTIEPRIGIRWNLTSYQALSFAYGLHSQLENLNLYLALNLEKRMPNKSLDFDKANHFVLGYDLKITENLVLKIEPYYQELFNIPVIPNFPFSAINLDDIYWHNDSLVNSGTGSNIGIDFTLERYMNKGFYYLITASAFDSKFVGGDSIERDTKYNRNFVINFVGGKEWFLGNNMNNILGVNVKFSYMGGKRTDALDMEATMAQKQIVYDKLNPFSRQLEDIPMLSLSISYRKNKPKYSSIWSLQIINALGYKEFSEYTFNYTTNKVEEVKNLFVLPILSYKIEF